MRTREALFSLCALLFSLFLTALGLLLLLGARQPRFAQAWRELPLTAFPLVSGLFFLGAALFLGLFFWCSRRRYLLIRMGGGHELRVLEETIAQLVTADTATPCDVIVRKKEKIEILVDLPYGSEEKLGELETSIESLLAKQLGYKDAFYLNVSFKAPLSAR